MEEIISSSSCYSLILEKPGSQSFSVLCFRKQNRSCYWQMLMRWPTWSCIIQVQFQNTYVIIGF